MTARFPLEALDRIEAAVASAGVRELMSRFRRLSDGDVQRKTSAFDVVTAADEAAEQAIAAFLATAFPGAVTIGEESAGREPALLREIAHADLCFVVDPLDGTKNFSAGLPLFGTMVAVVERGEVIAGVIHDPVTRSSALAARGGGAWVRETSHADRRLRVAEPVPVNSIEGIVGTNFLPEPLRSRVNGNLSRLYMTNWFRCSAHEYRLAAAGHTHVLLYNKLMPWDHAAGWLLHREAGGYSAHFDGSAYLPSHTNGGLLCAPDEASWREVREALFGER
jgi:fructose-1,6-bisphosphatase/inositol monophosphatase family enzyme